MQQPNLETRSSIENKVLIIREELGIQNADSQNLSSFKEIYNVIQGGNIFPGKWVLFGISLHDLYTGINT